MKVQAGVRAHRLKRAMIYINGFGWVADEGGGGVCEYADDMYENGNKIGSMGGGTFVDGDGDINKMIGIMD